MSVVWSLSTQLRRKPRDEQNISQLWQCDGRPFSLGNLRSDVLYSVPQLYRASYTIMVISTVKEMLLMVLVYMVSQNIHLKVYNAGNGLHCDGAGTDKAMRNY